MIPFLNLFSGVANFGAKYWKQICITGLLIWVIICTIFHLFEYSPIGSNGNSRTVVKTRDTIYLPADTSLILSLYGFDTIPTSVVVNEKSNWVLPETDYADAINCADSVDRVRVTLKMAYHLLEECDSMYRLATARRTYNDVLENDSIRVTMETVVDGHRIGKPKMDYVWLAPAMLVVDSITITDSIYYGGPRRGLYVEGSAGPRMTFNNQFNAVNATFGLGYLDKKGFRYGVRAGVSTKEDYSVEAVFSKEIYIGK